MAKFLGNDISFICKVVINDEAQYSIWPSPSHNPIGWKDAGYQGSKESCLEYIANVWTIIT